MEEAQNGTSDAVLRLEARVGTLEAGSRPGSSVGEPAAEPAARGVYGQGQVQGKWLDGIIIIAGFPNKLVANELKNQANAIVQKLVAPKSNSPTRISCWATRFASASWTGFPRASSGTWWKPSARWTPVSRGRPPQEECGPAVERTERKKKVQPWWLGGRASAS